MTNRADAVSIARCEDPAEAGALAAVGAETFAETFGHIYRPEDLEAFLREKHAPAVYRALIEDSACGVWLAKDESGAAVGYLVAGPCALPVPDMPEKSGELMRFYLLRDYQGAGIGRRMLEPALSWLDRHFDHVYLGVFSENDGAQRLYARYGFEKAHEYFFTVGDHADHEFIMKRRPNAAGSGAAEDVQRDPLVAGE